MPVTMPRQEHDLLATQVSVCDCPGRFPVRGMHDFAPFNLKTFQASQPGTTNDCKFSHYLSSSRFHAGLRLRSGPVKCIYAVQVTQIIPVIHTKAEHILVFDLQSDKICSNPVHAAIMLLFNQHRCIYPACPRVPAKIKDLGKGMTLTI